jgi:hypothetical protein
MWLSNGSKVTANGSQVEFLSAKPIKKLLQVFPSGVSVLDSCKGKFPDAGVISLSGGYVVNSITFEIFLPP